MMRIFLTISIFIFSAAKANTDFNGFFNPNHLPNFPLSLPEKNIYKIEIAPKMHGTAFSISKDLLLTNVHNVTQCLRDHGLINSGYDGSRGPLECKSLSLMLPDKSKKNLVQLLGSNARYNNKGMDFAVMRVPGLSAEPVSLSATSASIGEIVYVVGFPGITYRSKSAISEKMISLVNLLNMIFDFNTSIEFLDPKSMTSEGIFKFWLYEGFTKIQPHVVWSEFLSGSMIGKSWNPFTEWQTTPPEEFAQKLKSHIENFKKDSYLLLKVAEKASMGAELNYPDADGELKVSKAVVYREAEFGVKILNGDATPGSSGSLVVNGNGLAVGILFQLRGLEANSENLCLLDAVMTNFESINFSYCPALGVAFVSSDIILKKLSDWGISTKEF